MIIKKETNNKTHFLIIWLFILIISFLLSGFFLCFSLIWIPIIMCWKNKINFIWILTISCCIGAFIFLYYFNYDYNFFASLSHCIDILFGFSLKDDAINYIDAHYNQQTSSFIKLIIFNIKTEETSDFYYQTINLSIVYLICVSGFHFSILKNFINKIFKNNKKIGYYLSNSIILFYSYFLNFSFGSIRVLFSSLLSYPNSKLNITKMEKTMLVGIAICFICPNSINEISYLLSFLGTIAVIYVVNLNINNKFMEKLLINLLATIITLPFIVKMNHEISLFAIINSFIFGYLFCFIFIYFLIFSFFPFLTGIHYIVIEAVYFLVGNYSKLNVMIPLFGWSENINVFYYSFFYLTIFLINNKIYKV